MFSGFSYLNLSKADSECPLYVGIYFIRLKSEVSVVILYICQYNNNVKNCPFMTQLRTLVTLDMRCMGYIIIDIKEEV